MALELPARIGKYELEEYLGGGMSEVYRARDTVIGRTVAVKILTEQGSADPDAKARFLQEARLAGNIEHDNVISIYDFGEDARHRPFMVMEFLRGEDLRHAIREGHTGDLKAKLKIALQIARALGYIHSLDIIHRDIKPENVHLTATGVVKLMDFGIAKPQGLSMTRTGYVMGTPYYMAPEQVLGKNISLAVDTYAFGILLFELLTGARPFSGDTVERIFYAILNEPIDLAPLGTSIPQPVCDIIGHCTAKDPALRPPNIETVAGEIERILMSMEAPERLPTPQPQPVVSAPAPGTSIAKPWIAAVLGVALLVAIGVLVKIVLTPKRATPAAPPPAAAAPALLSATLTATGGDMVLISGGKFLFGREQAPKALPAFYIDKTEVTNAAYEKFCREKQYPLPAGFPANQPDHPVVNVTIADARAFAQWAEKRLPTAQEWEKAARGTEGRLFPWGDQRDPGFANVRDNATLAKHELMPVGGFPQGASPYGVLDMVGNVWEFVDETVTPEAVNVAYFAKQLRPPPGPQEPWYEVRGEPFSMPLAGKSKAGDFIYKGIWDDGATPVRWKDSIIGFRCVKDPAPAR